MSLPVLLLALLATNANGKLVVSCDCDGFVLFVDGQPAHPFAPFATITGIAPGRHSVKVEVPNGIFSTETWFNGYVDVPEGTEMRAKVKKGTFEVYSKTAIGPQASAQAQQAPAQNQAGISMTVTGSGPPAGAPPGADPLAEILAAIEEAGEKNDDLDSKCQKKVANRLDGLAKKVKELRDDGSLAAFERALSKAEDVEEFIGDACPDKVAKAVNRKLSRAIEGLEALIEKAKAQAAPQAGAVTASASGGTSTVTTSSWQQSGSVSLNVNVGGMFSEPSPATAPTYVEPAYRDCGTGQDPGCVMTRDGHYPMDAEAFSGFMQSLRGNPNELSRQEIAEEVLASSHLTAKQLGMVLDAFQNELLKLEVAKAAASRVVDPKNAIGHSSKFRSSIHQSEYVKLMATR